jgi:hypothetical protein
MIHIGIKGNTSHVICFGPSLDGKEDKKKSRYTARKAYEDAFSKCPKERRLISIVISSINSSCSFISVALK